MRRLFDHRGFSDELRKSEARYRTVLDAAFDAIVTITPEGIVRWFNRGAERAFGHRADEVIGEPVTLLMPERYRELCVAGLHRYLRTGEARVVGGTTELVGLRKDGSEFPIEMSLGETHENGQRLFTGVIRDITERKRTEDALREARDRFESVFDHGPIGVTVVSPEGRYLQVNRSLCEILGYSEEDLLDTTWQEITHPDDPGEFLSVAEDTGMILQMGEEVLREACHQLRAWQQRYPVQPPLTVSVNLSPRQLFRPELVAEILAETGLDPGSLQLEITEGVMTSNDANSANNTLRSLKDLNIQLAVDDFGMGYSSLSYLKRFPVDFLKIDRSFIAGLGQDIDGTSKDAEVVPAMIDLTHALGLKAVAEGVETAEQLAQLRNMGCDFAQGNYLSEPLPGEELSILLEQNLTNQG